MMSPPTLQMVAAGFDSGVEALYLEFKNEIFIRITNQSNLEENKKVCEIYTLDELNKLYLMPMSFPFIFSKRFA